MNLATTLKGIISDPQMHARWLNSLSYLEYRGFRKIARSRSTEEMTFDILMHTAEEVRHSLFFKKQAVRIGGNDFDSFREDALMCPESLKSYFFEIDSKATLAISSLEKHLLSGAAYSLVTWLVEKRAMSIYQVYEELLKASSARFSLSGVLKEESLHLKEVGNNAERLLIKHGFDIALISAIEEREFNKLWSLIEANVLGLGLKDHPEIAV